MRTNTMPEISTDFTVVDIRKLRDWYGDRFADMTHSEIAEEVNNGAMEFIALIENTRNNQQTGVSQ